MKRLPVVGLLTALLVSCPHAHASDGHLTLHASTVDAQIEPVAPEQRRLYLPMLTFTLQARFACAAPMATATVTVSIADAHEHYEPGDDEHSITATIDVPRRQLPPVATGDFCVQSSPNHQKYLVLPGIATAQVSLRCQSDTHASVRYASAPLAVRLECGSSEDQEPPAETVSAAR